MTISGDTTVETAPATRAPRVLIAAIIVGAVLAIGGVVAAIAVNEAPLDPRTVAAPSGFQATEVDWGCNASTTSACWTSAQEPSEIRDEVSAWVGSDSVLFDNDKRFVVCGTLRGERVNVGVDRRVVNAVVDGSGALVVSQGVTPIREGSVISVYTDGDLGC